MSRLLDRTAAAYGIERAFIDSSGRLRLVSTETKRVLLRAMGVDAGSPSSLREATARALLAQAMPPVLVVEAGADGAIALPTHARSATWRLTLESGDTLEGSMPRDPGRRGRLLLPAPLPVGYHRLELERPERQQHTITIVAAPRSCPLPEDLGVGQVFGLGCRVRSLRSGRGLGSGDLADLASLVERAAREGADFVAVDPLHALLSAAPAAASPGTFSHRAFLDWRLIAPDHVPELVADPALAAEIPRLREEARAQDGTPLDHPATAHRRRLLEAAFEHFRAQQLGPQPAARGSSLKTFRQVQGEPLRLHCLFEALHEHVLAREPGRWAWWQWPEPYRRPDHPDVQAFAREHADRLAFFAWLQWLADEQLADVQARARAGGMRLGLYRDLAIGTSPAGSLAWAEQDVVARGVSIGAPPDPLNPKGGDWGLAPLSPGALAARAYGPWLHDIRANMRHAGTLRIEHVMGLRRLFWIPEGAAPEDGAYVRYPFTTLVALLAVEAHRQRCLVVGEDLGALPRGFRPALRKVGILSSRVLYFERERNGGFGSQRRYRHASVASIGARDLPTLEGFLAERDIDRRERQGLYPSAEEVLQGRRERQRDRTRLLRLLQRAGLVETGAVPDLPELTLALYRWLARTPAALLLVQLEDLVLAAEQPDEHHRLEPELEELFSRPLARHLLAMLREERPRQPPSKPPRAEPEAAHDVLFHEGA
ncbi:4-alpha-glucanotransferase [Benzoatithermus flavus]|uniref:4-alpha-glucanotransferase n=1 Tax=Benzoatithermus flavus TaxID=3108223 RepID=A0ABU8XPT5_9PROT